MTIRELSEYFQIFIEGSIYFVLFFSYPILLGEAPLWYIPYASLFGGGAFAVLSMIVDSRS